MLRVVLCNCPPADSPKIAEFLIKENLAACVNIIPGVKSYYEWEGELVVEDEHTLLIKTTDSRYPALEKRLAEIHPYSVPEIVALPVSASFEAYFQWVLKQTSQE